VPATDLRLLMRRLFCRRLSCRRFARWRWARGRMRRLVGWCSPLRECHGGRKRENAQRSNESLHGILIDGIEHLYRRKAH
jgi:hypothetical protein